MVLFLLNIYYVFNNTGYFTPKILFINHYNCEEGLNITILYMRKLKFLQKLNNLPKGAVLTRDRTGIQIRFI